LPNSVGLLLLGLVASIVLVGVDFLFPAERLYDQIGESLRQIDFTQIVFNGMLAFLLFAGALNVNVDALRRRAGAVAYLAIAGTLISTAVIGVLFYVATSWLGLAVPLPWALVFGALISPTDPVAVLSMLKGVPIPEQLRVEAEGEALLNDGIGVVLFTLLLSIAAGGGDLNLGSIAWDFVREAGGGIAIGLVSGYIAYRAMRAIDDFPIEVLITLALVTGSYALAQRLGASGPLATVAAGLLVGHRAPQDAMSEQTEKYVSALWTLVDEVLNAMLFLLIGLEVFVLDPSLTSVLVAVVAVPIALLARWVAVAAPLLVPFREGVHPRYVPFLTWAAVRGGISVALALALPQIEAKPVILAATYGVVLFSILVQGPTLGPLARRLKL
jgi:CPA1 family monovalent cation:H+ antiporter